jgi:dTMP kinase
VKKGKFIVIYGANNLGKTTQAKILVKKLKKTGRKVKLIKYPVYDLEPTGSIVNKFLRKNLRLTEYEAQYIFVRNRWDYQPTLEKMLNNGIWVVAEDYKGTSICWGATHGVPLSKMIKLNSGVKEEDLVILLDGTQFKDSIEKRHHNETSKMWDKGRKMHLKVGKMFDWKKVKADDPVDKVAENIWKEVEKVLD